jgi:hypothetical protein
MVNQLALPSIRWFAPAPLWGRPGAVRLDHTNGSVGQPAILRFSTDLFMEELLALTASYPERLADWIAQYETWREPMPAPSAAADLRLTEPVRPRRGTPAGVDRADVPVRWSAPNGTNKGPLKLYQPVHQRHYLVAAALVCQQPGLPDRIADRARQEQLGFVVRRVSAGDPADPAREEYAFVAEPDGFSWRRVPVERRQALEPGEERLPLFAINFQHCARDRQLLAGTVPVGKREAYLAAPGWGDTGAGDSVGAAHPRTRLGLLFDADVASPWRALVEQAHLFEQAFLAPPAHEEEDADQRRQDYVASLARLRGQIQTGSWYVLLDFAKFLDRYLNSVWRSLKNDPSVDVLSGPEEALAQAIRNTALRPDLVDALAGKFQSLNYSVAADLATALVSVTAWEAQLESVESALDLGLRVDPSGEGWPDFLFPLANPALEMDEIVRNGNLFALLPSPEEGAAALDDSALSLDAKLDRIERLAELVHAALPEEGIQAPELEPAPGSWDKREAWFVIRCVFERPRCGPGNQMVVSNATQPFQMAAFFDPDGPARPVRIPMPLDVSPAGLRKYKKNTTFMISDMLCGQIERIKKLTLGDLVLSVLPWPFHKDLPNVGAGGSCKKGGLDIGMWCSLSIPIVTLCALILLIIMVALFDLFFKWLPFLFVCLPIPGLKGKKS